MSADCWESIRSRSIGDVSIGCHQVTGERRGVDPFMNGVLVRSASTSSQVLNVDDDPPGGGALSTLDADVIMVREASNHNMGGGVPRRTVCQTCKWRGMVSCSDQVRKSS